MANSVAKLTRPRSEKNAFARGSSISPWRICQSGHNVATR
jgi:hypothetical protein